MLIGATRPWAAALWALVSAASVSSLDPEYGKHYNQDKYFNIYSQEGTLDKKVAYIRNNDFPNSNNEVQ